MSHSDNQTSTASPVTATVAAPRVSIVIPCRNEKRYIEGCIRSLLEGQEPAEGMEIIVADGMSDDGTRELLNSLARKDGRIRVVDNPGRTVPYGMNAGIRAARGEIIVRIDAHTQYAPDYLVRNVETLDRTHADVVGGPWVAQGKGYIGRAIAAAFRSPFGMGGGKSHSATYDGPLDTVYLGCWRKDRLIEVGLFDEEFTRNQDDELNLRIIRAGGTVYQSSAVKSVYVPRDSLSKLFRQYAQYGFWKVRVIQKHHLPASVRHLIPALFVLGIVLGAPLAMFSKPLAWGYAAFWGLYLLADLVGSILALGDEDRRLGPLLPVVFFIFHFAYGLGFLRGLLHFLILRRGVADANERATRLTR